MFQFGEFPDPGKGQRFLLFKAFNWSDNLYQAIYLTQSTNLNVIFIQKHLTETLRIMFAQSSWYI